VSELDILWFLYEEVSVCTRQTSQQKVKQREGDPLDRRGELVSGQWCVNTLCIPCHKAEFCRW